MTPETSLPTVDEHPVRCPGCSSMRHKVIDTYKPENRNIVHRKRKCLECGTMFRSSGPKH